jgi:adenylylsulfate kinase
MVIWITGLSGSGKTSLSRALYRLLKPSRPSVVRLDGDEIREAFGADLSHREGDRVRQIERIQRIAGILCEQDIDVLVGALYARADLLAWNRRNFPDYFEIYIKADLDLLRARDTNALYARALRGELHDVVGVDIAWNAPTSPDLVIDAATAPPPEILAKRVVDALPRLARSPAAERVRRA